MLIHYNMMGYENKIVSRETHIAGQTYVSRETCIVHCRLYVPRETYT